MAADPSDPRTRTVLVYSDDSVIRDRVITSIGRRPSTALGAIDYLQADTGEGVVRAVRTGMVDLCILDGEAWPTGGMAICRQLRDELDHCPPLLLLIGRRDDAWLGTWSRADAMVPHPIDPVDLAASAVKLLTPPADPLPAAPLAADPLPAAPLAADPLPGEPLPGEPLPAHPLPTPGRR